MSVSALIELVRGDATLVLGAQVGRTSHRLQKVEMSARTPPAVHNTSSIVSDCKSVRAQQAQYSLWVVQYSSIQAHTWQAMRQRPLLHKLAMVEIDTQKISHNLSKPAEKMGMPAGPGCTPLCLVSREETSSAPNSFFPVTVLLPSRRAFGLVENAAYASCTVAAEVVLECAAAARQNFAVHRHVRTHCALRNCSATVARGACEAERAGNLATPLAAGTGCVASGGQPQTEFLLARTPAKSPVKYN
eukprot:6178575-Pleurochrysis_carterae.AAC.11